MEKKNCNERISIMRPDRLHGTHSPWVNSRNTSPSSTSAASASAAAMATLTPMSFRKIVAVFSQLPEHTIGSVARTTNSVDLDLVGKAVGTDPFPSFPFFFPFFFTFFDSESGFPLFELFDDLLDLVLLSSVEANLLSFMGAIFRTISSALFEFNARFLSSHEAREAAQSATTRKRSFE